MVLEFSNLVKVFLKGLPDDDFPVLNTRLFVSCWLSLAMDKSIVSMQDLFKRLNNTGYPVKISTFSKASKHRKTEPFVRLYQSLLQETRKRIPQNKLMICPIDSTIVGLTSKLLWAEGCHHVKLFSCLNSESGSTEGSLIHFGYSHDYQFVEQMTEAIPDNGVGVMDRGFASREYLQKVEASNKLYVLRINSNYKIEYGEGDLVKLGTGTKAGWYRLVHFCDLETKVEYRLVTNLPYWEEGSKEVAISNAEVGEIYRQRWGIELLWKFLKMHLKLSRLMTKNKNGIEIQIYTTLIAYLLLQLVTVPKAWGEKLLDKLRYLQCCMNQELSYVHWLERLLKVETKCISLGKVRRFAA